MKQYEVLKSHIRSGLTESIGLAPVVTHQSRHHFTGHGILDVIAVSFLSAYAALWLSLLCDKLTILYNKIYESIQTADTSEDPQAVAEKPAPAGDEGCQKGDSEVPKMQQQ